MKKEDFIKQIENLNEESFTKFANISEQILDLIEPQGKIDTSISNIPLSQKLKKARKEKRLTQIKLAKKLHVSRGIIGDIETDRREASKGVAKKLSNYFHTDVGYWL